MSELRDWKGAAERLGVKEGWFRVAGQARQRSDLSEAVAEDDPVPRRRPRPLEGVVEGGDAVSGDTRCTDRWWSRADRAALLRLWADGDPGQEVDGEATCTICKTRYSGAGLFARPRQHNTAWFSVVPDNEAAQYCGLDPGYFRDQIKEGRGPSYVKPSDGGVLHARVVGSLDGVVVRSDEPIQPVGR